MRDAKAEARIGELKHDLEPVIAQLRHEGYDIRSLDELRRSGERYESAVPILLAWLPRLASADAKEGIVRALSVPWAKPTAGTVLVREFENTPKQSEALRWAIGNALEVVATPDVVEGIIRIVERRENGAARQMAVLALAKIKDPRSVPVLIALLDDDEVAGHAIMALRKLRAAEALHHLGPFIDPSTSVDPERGQKGHRGDHKTQPTDQIDLVIWAGGPDVDGRPSVGGWVTLCGAPSGVAYPFRFSKRVGRSFLFLLEARGAPLTR